jgi:hypothetical protein
MALHHVLFHCTLIMLKIVKMKLTGLSVICTLCHVPFLYTVTCFKIFDEVLFELNMDQNENHVETFCVDLPAHM